MVKVTYKHWQTGKELWVIGTMLEYNNPLSDRIVVKTDEGNYEDIIKTTIIEIIEFINESYDKELATAIYNDCKDLGEAQDMIEKYEGSFDSVKDYGEHYAENFMNIPENLSYYIDYEKLGRDYGMDSHKIDANNTTHYFYN